MSTDDWTLPADFPAGTLARATLNQQVPQNMLALYNAIVGDAQATGEVIQRQKRGTFASRPAAGNAGRMYVASDRVDNTFMDDGTVWRPHGAVVAYDTFDRAASTTLGNADSGHPWTETSGDMEITANKRLNALAADSFCTIDLGCEQRVVECTARILADNTQTTINFGVAFRVLDYTEFLMVGIRGNAGGDPNTLRIFKRVVSVDTVLATQALTPVVSVAYTLNIKIAGGIVDVFAHEDDMTPLAHVAYDTIADTLTPFSGNTKFGIWVPAATTDEPASFMLKVLR